MAIDLKALKKNQSYNAIAPVSEVLDDLTKLAALDKEAEQQMERYGKLRGWFIFGVILSVVMATIVPFFLIAIIGFIISAWWASSRQRECGSLDLPDEQYQFAEEITQVLARDMTAEQQLQLDVSFRGILHDSNKVSSQRYVKRSGWKLDHYRQEWFKAQGQFADATRFSLVLVEFMHYVHGYKRSASGKRKYKSKRKPKGTTLDLQLMCPRKRYGALDLLRNDAENAIKRLPDVQLKRCRITPKGLAITLKLPAQFSASQIQESIIMLLLSAYQVLNLAQQLSEKPKKSKKQRSPQSQGGRIGA